MRLIISGGGTGGHVYPALATIPALTERCPTLDLVWVGSYDGMEQALVERENVPFIGIPTAGLRGKNPLHGLQALWKLSQGYRQSLRFMRQFQPNLLFVTGGYVCVPMALAARWLGVPIVIYLPDIEPGLAIKYLARLANRVAVTTTESQAFFEPSLTVVTGYPVRPDLLLSKAEAPPAAARQRFGLAKTDMPLWLVFGGSRGARSLNQAVTAQLERYLTLSQIIHVTGTLDIEWVQQKRAALPKALQGNYFVSPYLHNEMSLALQAADLVLSRAGASILGEFPAVGLPSILVPYPYAGAHQQLNANYLAKHQAAIVISDTDLKRKLPETFTNLITNRQRLTMMSQACNDLFQPDAPANLAQAILEVKHVS